MESITGNYVSQTIPQQTCPPSDKTFRKNGKKVRKNIGLVAGTLITTVMAGSMLDPCIPEIRENRHKVSGTEAEISLHQDYLNNKGNVRKDITSEQIVQCKESLAKYKKELSKSYKTAAKITVLGIALAIGAIAFCNHMLNNKRAKLAAEPDQNTKVDLQV